MLLAKKVIENINSNLLSETCVDINWQIAVFEQLLYVCSNNCLIFSSPDGHGLII